MNLRRLLCIFGVHDWKFTFNFSELPDYSQPCGMQHGSNHYSGECRWCGERDLFRGPYSPGDIPVAPIVDALKQELLITSPSEMRSWASIHGALSRLHRPPSDPGSESGAAPDGWQLVPKEPTEEWARKYGSSGNRCIPWGHAAHDIRDMLAASPSPGPVAGDGWQDIATAPKDGTVVDVWSAKQGEPLPAKLAGYHPYLWLHHPADNPLDRDPTHWRPRPIPPSKEGGGA